MLYSSFFQGFICFNLIYNFAHSKQTKNKTFTSDFRKNCELVFWKFWSDVTIMITTNQVMIINIMAVIDTLNTSCHYHWAYLS